MPKGQEVHNTYGELGNAELVVKYGFALRRNPFDVVLLDKGELVEEARRIVGDRACRQRCKFLSRDRWRLAHSTRHRLGCQKFLLPCSGRHKNCIKYIKEDFCVRGSHSWLPGLMFIHSYYFEMIDMAGKSQAREHRRTAAAATSARFTLDVLCAASAASCSVCGLQ